MLAPNKQNLILLKGQLKLIKNGHKLLKEKRSGLIVNFLDLSRRGRNLEQELSKDLSGVLAAYESSLTFVSAHSLLKNLTTVPAILFRSVRKRMSGVYIQNFSITIQPPQRPSLKTDITSSLSAFAHVFPVVLELAQLKINCTRLANEILKTNRQISNLERRTDETNGQIKFIKSALEEQANFEKATLISIFK